MSACRGCHENFQFTDLNTYGYCHSCAKDRARMKQKLAAELPPPPAKPKSAPPSPRPPQEPPTAKLPVAKLGLFAIAAAGFAIAYAIWSRPGPDSIQEQYVSALSDCASNPSKGAAAIEALDALHGQSARPRELSYRLSLCLTEGALDRADRLLNILERN